VEVININRCLLGLDLPDFQDIGIDDPRPSRSIIIEDFIFPVSDEIPVIIKEIINIGDIFYRKYLQVFQPVNTDQEPVVGLLIDKTTVKGIFIENPCIVDNGTSVIIVIEMEDCVVADGIAEADAANDIPEFGKKVVGIISPDDHFKVYGKEKGMERRFEDDEPAVAGADE